MKAVMSKIVKKILSNRKTARELTSALNKLHNSEDDSVTVTIGDEIYTIRNVRVK